MPPQTKVSFATCNLLNLNLPGLDSYSDRIICAGAVRNEIEMAN